MNPVPVCCRCERPASEIEEYRDLVDPEDGEVDWARLIRAEEGTYNPETNTFACTPYYIALGMPASPTGWKAPAVGEAGS